LAQGCQIVRREIGTADREHPGRRTGVANRCGPRQPG
jgi:hypothetical protein